MSNIHARFSPSNSKRWLHCTASMTLATRERQEQSSYALRGTALHAMAEDILLNNDFQSEYEGYEPTDDDINTVVNPYVNYVRSLDVDLDYIELQVRVSEDCYGTADFVGFNSETGDLHIADLKAGSGVFVRAENNTQLQIYALGALKTLPYERKHCRRVFIHVCQPAVDNMTCVEVSLDELWSLERRIKKTIEKVKNKEVEFVATEEGCRWCAHKTTCPKLQEYANKVAKNDFEGVELSEKLNMVPVLKTFIKAVEEESLERLKREEDLPGFKLVRSRGKKVFKDEDRFLLEIDKAGISVQNFFQPKKMLTVIQSSKVLKKLGSDLDMDIFIEQKEGALKVVPSQAPESARNKTSEAIKDFKVTT